MSGTFHLGPGASAAGYRLFAYDSVGSTNTEALKRARAGDPGLAWFAALQQTEGRGRRGRPWQSAHGNLAASLLVVLEGDTAHIANLGFVAGVALAEALSELMPDARSAFALKWPNDVLANGAKLAGILLEAQRLPDNRQAVIVGIGVNIAVAPQGLPYPATSLREWNAALDAHAVFAALSEHWARLYPLWDEGRGLAQILGKWQSVAAGLGGEVTVETPGGQVRGIFEALDPTGRMLVRDDKDVVTPIAAGDVFFGTAASAR